MWNIKEIIIPENVSHIGMYAFEYVDLQKIVWNAKSLQIEWNAPAYAPFPLSYNNLDTIIIGEKVTSLPEYMFYSGIYSLTPVIISKNKVPPTIQKNTFDALSPKSKLYVPKGTKEEYKKKWSKFTNIYELEEDTGLDDLFQHRNEQIEKILYKGNVYILLDGDIYTFMGQKININQITNQRSVPKIRERVGIKHY